MHTWKCILENAYLEMHTWKWSMQVCKYALCQFRTCAYLQMHTWKCILKIAYFISSMQFLHQECNFCILELSMQFLHTCILELSMQFLHTCILESSMQNLHNLDSVKYLKIRVIVWNIVFGWNDFNFFIFFDRVHHQVLLSACYLCKKIFW